MNPLTVKKTNQCEETLKIYHPCCLLYQLTLFSQILIFLFKIYYYKCWSLNIIMLLKTMLHKSRRVGKGVYFV